MTQMMEVFDSRERSLYKSLCILASLPDGDYSSALNEEPGAQGQNCNASWFDGAERQRQLGFGAVIDLQEISLYPFGRARR